VQLVGFIIRNLTQRTVTRTSNFLNSCIFIYLRTICFSKAVINSDDKALSDWITAAGVETASCDIIQGTIQPVVEANRCDILKGSIQPFSQRDRNTNRNLSHVRQSSVHSRHLTTTSGRLRGL